MRHLLTAVFAATCGLVLAAPVPNAVADRLAAPALGDSRVQGPIGAKFDTFMYERCWGPFALGVVLNEAEFAF